MLTISQLATHAGVTVRAIRHYHERGLLAEPPRDASGYRRYDAHAVLALARIKTLADAGVALGRIPRLLAASPEEFDRAIGALEVALAARIDAMTETRARLRTLRGGYRFGLPANVVRHLDRLRALGLTEAQVLRERDVWVLLVARYPERIPHWLGRLGELLDDREIAELYLDLHAARDWSPEDPRLAQIAGRAAKLAQRRHGDWPGTAVRVSRLVNEFGGPVTPAMARLAELVDVEVSPSSVDDH